MVEMIANRISQPNMMGALVAAENIKANRLSNELSQQRMGLEQERLGIARQNLSMQRDALGRQRQAAQAGGRFLMGDQDAYETLAGIDPEYAIKLKTAVGALNDADKARAAAQYDEIGTLAEGFSQMDPVQQSAMYPVLLKRIRANDIDPAAMGLPEQYDPEAIIGPLQMAAIEAKTVKDLMGPAPTTAIQEIEYGMRLPEDHPGRKRLLEGKPGVVVQNNMAEKGSGELGKIMANKFDEAQGAGSSANVRMSDRQILRDALSNPDLYTGAGGDAVLTAKKVAATMFGLDLKGVPDGEIVQRISTEAALDLTSKLEGTISNKELGVVMSMPVGLAKTPEANRRLLEIGDLADGLAIDKAAAWREHLNEDGSINPKIYSAIAKIERDYRNKIKGHISELTALDKQVKNRSPLAGIPVGTMSVDQLTLYREENRDVNGKSTLTKAQLRKAADRWNQLQQQGAQ